MPDPVEFVQLSGQPTAIINGISLWGATASEREGGQQMPQYKAEENYEFQTRIGPKPVKITVNGWTDASGFVALASLEQYPEPFPAAGPNFIGDSWGLESYVDETPENRPGAHKVSLQLREVIRGSTQGASTNSVNPRRTPQPGPTDRAGGDGNGPSTVQTTTAGPI